MKAPEPPKRRVGRPNVKHPRIPWSASISAHTGKVLDFYTVEMAKTIPTSNPGRMLDCLALHAVQTKFNPINYINK